MNEWIVWTKGEREENFWEKSEEPSEFVKKHAKLGKRDKRKPRPCLTKSQLAHFAAVGTAPAVHCPPQ